MHRNVGACRSSLTGARGHVDRTGAAGGLGRSFDQTMRPHYGGQILTDGECRGAGTSHGATTSGTGEVELLRAMNREKYFSNSVKKIFLSTRCVPGTESTRGAKTRQNLLSWHVQPSQEGSCYNPLPPLNDCVPLAKSLG